MKLICWSLLKVDKLGYKIHANIAVSLVLGQLNIRIRHELQPMHLSSRGLARRRHLETGADQDTGITIVPAGHELLGLVY